LPAAVTEAPAEATQPPPVIQATDEPAAKVIWEHRSELRDGEFLNPNMAAFDAQGNIYVTDGNCQVQVFNVQGGFIRRWGSCGVGDGIFSNPEGIAISSDGFIYVVDKLYDSNGRVQVFDQDSNFVRTFGSLASPSGIAIGPDGNIFVVEQGSQRIIKFTPQGEQLTAWGGEGAGEGQFDFRNGSPSGVAVDANGQVYVADMANNRIQVFDSDGQFLRQWGPEKPEKDRFNWPLGVAIDIHGTVYVVDSGNARVLSFDAEGNLLGSFGSPGGEDGQFGSSYMGPQGVAVNPDGLILVTDTVNDRMQLFNPDGSHLRSWGTRAFSRSGELLYASGVALAPDGSVYVADSGHGAISHFTAQGEFLEVQAVGGYPTSLDTDAHGDLFYVDINSATVTRLSPDGSMVAQWGGADYSDDPSKTPEGKFYSNCVNDLAVVKDRVYVVDGCAHRIQVFDTEGKYLFRWGSEGEDPGQFRYPGGIAADLEGSLLVIDTGNTRVQKKILP
jgi:DNA-binding beta-propeller fold protein YncE